MQKNLSIPDEVIVSKIYFVRGLKVMLDKDLAELYNVSTKVLNQAVHRNIPRFPSDFMFQLTPEESKNLKSQIVTSSWGGARKLSFAFTEQGVAMLSGVLHSERAIVVNINIIRIFIKLRELLISHKDILLKLEQFESKLVSQDKEIQILFQAIRELMSPPILPHPPQMKKVGYKRKDEED